MWLSVSKQFSQRLFCGFFAAHFALGPVSFLEVAPGKIELLAVIGAILFLHRFRSSLATLVGYGEVEVSAVAATTQVSVTLLANITPARQTVDFPFLTTVETMPCHARRLNA